MEKEIFRWRKKSSPVDILFLIGPIPTVYSTINNLCLQDYKGVYRLL